MPLSVNVRNFAEYIRRLGIKGTFPAEVAQVIQPVINVADMGDLAEPFAVPTAIAGGTELAELLEFSVICLEAAPTSLGLHVMSINVAVPYRVGVLAMDENTITTPGIAIFNQPIAQVGQLTSRVIRGTSTDLAFWNLAPVVNAGILPEFYMAPDRIFCVAGLAVNTAITASFLWREVPA